MTKKQKKQALKKEEMSLDDILSSIRSIVMDANDVADINKNTNEIFNEDRKYIKKSNNNELSIIDTENIKVLNDITEQGNVIEKPPFVSGRSAFKMEESIQEILEILEANKEQLPNHFFERQDEFLKIWLNSYLPEMVERVVQKEVRRMIEYVQINK